MPRNFRPFLLDVACNYLWAPNEPPPPSKGITISWADPCPNALSVLCCDE